MTFPRLWHLTKGKCMISSEDVSGLLRKITILLSLTEITLILAYLEMEDERYFQRSPQRIMTLSIANNQKFRSAKALPYRITC